MSDDNRERALRWFDEIWNQRRDRTIEELCSPDLEASVEGVDGPISRPEFKVYRDALLSAIPDLRVEIDGTSADGAKVAVSWTVTGRHTGPGLGIPPSGRPIHIEGLTWLEFEDGRVVRGCDRWNRGALIQSLVAVRVREIQRGFGLTSREAEVAVLLAERRTHKEIAKDLGIRPNTARRHSQKVLRKLGIHSKKDVKEAIGLPVSRKGTSQRHLLPAPRSSAARLRSPRQSR